jgi:hypothetical protein
MGGLMVATWNACLADSSEKDKQSMKGMLGAKRRGFAVGAFALAVALALAGCGAGRQQPKTGAATTTIAPAATATLSPTPAPGPWTAVTNLTSVANFAPAQFRVQLQTFTGQQAKGDAPELWLKRSYDFGATYHTVALPSIPGGTTPTNVQYIHGEQSPLNPSVYFLTVQTQARCANSEPCQYQYVTMNGGTSWLPLTLPVHGVLGIENTAHVDSAVAQGQRLYGVVTDVAVASSGVVPPGRLVASDDGGATWSVADASIFAANCWIYGFAISLRGSTVVAIAGQNFGSMLPAQTPIYSLWRSDNGGATWRNMGPPPVKVSPTVRAAGIPQNGKTAIYVLGAGANNTVRLFASVDGGATWPDSYTFSISADASGPGVTLIGTLADGAVVIASYDNSTLAWSPGDKTPTTIFPAPPGVTYEQSELLTPPNSQGVYYLWITTQDANGATIYYYASAQ